MLSFILLHWIIGRWYYNSISGSVAHTVPTWLQVTRWQNYCLVCIRAHVTRLLVKMLESPPWSSNKGPVKRRRRNCWVHPSAGIFLSFFLFCGIEQASQTYALQTWAPNGWFITFLHFSLTYYLFFGKCTHVLWLLQYCTADESLARTLLNKHSMFLAFFF